MTRAVTSDPLDHHARRLRAQLHFMGGDVQTDLAELREAHDLNPNCALMLSSLDFYEAINGDLTKGVGLAETGLCRSAGDPAQGSMFCALGFAQFAAGNYAAAVTAAEAAFFRSL